MLLQNLRYLLEYYSFWTPKQLEGREPWLFSAKGILVFERYIFANQRMAHLPQLFALSLRHVRSGAQAELDELTGVALFSGYAWMEEVTVVAAEYSVPVLFSLCDDRSVLPSALINASFPL